MSWIFFSIFREGFLASVAKSLKKVGGGIQGQMGGMAGTGSTEAENLEESMKKVPVLSQLVLMIFHKFIVIFLLFIFLDISISPHTHSEAGL